MNGRAEAIKNGREPIPVSESRVSGNVVVDRV